MAQRALITGASGFAGGYLIEHLQAMGDTVLACDRVGPEDRATDQGDSGRANWIPWDMADSAGIATDTRKQVERFAPGAIYHLAAMSVPADCGKDEPTPEAMAVNVEGTRRVLELAASLATRPRVLVVSSSHVYAPVTVESPIVSEDSPIEPRGGYGKTKLAAETISLELAEQAGLDVVIARAFKHAGPRQGERLMLAEWASQFARPSKEPVRIRTRDAHIDISDVRDIVRAYRLLVEKGVAGQVYNVGSGVNRRCGDLFDMLHQMADRSRPVTETRPGAKQDPVANISRLTECTGWRPEISMEKTIADTWGYWSQKEV